jgi:TonB family protein
MSPGARSSLPGLLPRAFAAVALLPLMAACDSPTGLVDSASRASASSAPQASPTTSLADGLAPRVISWGGLTDLDHYYPKDAERDGIEGLVRIAVTLDKEGRATDTKIVSETPPDRGFGAAASAAVHTMTYSNPTGKEAVLTFNVKFAPADDPDATPRNRHRHHGRARNAESG